MAVLLDVLDVVDEAVITKDIVDVEVCVRVAENVRENVRVSVELGVLDVDTVADLVAVKVGVTSTRGTGYRFHSSPAVR